MATKEAEDELQEVRIDLPTMDSSGRTPEDVLEDPNKGSQDGGVESAQTFFQDDDNAAGILDMPAADPNGHTPEDVLKDLNEAIRCNDVKAFNQHLADLERLLQDDSTVGKQLAANGALCYAASVGSIPMMDTLIQKGVDINTKSYIPEFGGEITPLHWAVIRCSIDTLKYLIHKGANVNIKVGKGCTPLHKSVNVDNLDTVRCFVDNGAHVNVTTDDGNTPLHLAAKEGSHDAVKCLVSSGANVNSRNHWGMTPLQMATMMRHNNTEKYLVDHGAVVETKDSREVLENLKKAIQEGDVESFNMRLVEVENFFENEDSTLGVLAASGALCYAAEVGSIPMMDTLIYKGVDVNTKSSNINVDGLERKWSPLHMAARSGKVDIVRFLTEKGANINIKDDNGSIPLHMAAKSGSVDTVRYLVDKGADVNIENQLERTPLHLATKDGHLDVVKYLVESTDVNNNNIVKALQHATGGGHAEIVGCLLDKGAADPTAKDREGNNPLSQTIRSRHKAAATVLLGHDKWKEMLKSSLVIGQGKPTTPMRGLIAVMPDVAEIAFNKCVATNEGEEDCGNEVLATSETFEVDYNYEFLEDFKDKHSLDRSAESWRPEMFTKKDHPLYLMMKHGCSNLLKHPLVISLLEHKWTRFGRYIFFGNLFIYLAFLTAFGLVVLSPVERTCVDVFDRSFNGTALENCEGLSIHEYQFLYVAAAITILTALIRLGVEIFQFYRHPLEYLLDWVNWLEIPLYLFSVIFTFVFATPCLCVYSWQWRIGVVAVFLGWVGLITFLQKLPAMGVYVLMFVNILGSFLKVAFLALLLVVAFAFAFYMLLFDPDEMRTPFSHPGRALVKVMAMTTGELDFDELYHQQEGQDEIAFPVLSFLFWIIFLVLMPVLLSNLLVGLAVGDVDRLQKTAYENRIKLQIDLVLSFEELLESLGIRQRFAIKPKIHYPNVPLTLVPEWCKGGTADWDWVANSEQHTGRLAKVQQWIAKWYSKLWITDEYSTFGVNISDAIKPPPESLEKQLQKQRQHLEAKLQEQGGHQSQQLETKIEELNEQIEINIKEQLEVQLKEQNMHQSVQLEAKLIEHSEKQSEQLEAKLMEHSGKQSEQLEAKLMEHSEKLSEQLEAKLIEHSEKQSEQLEAKLMEHSEKLSERFEETVRQLSECQKAQAKQSEELAERMDKQSEQQAKQLEEQTKKMTEQLTGEVASLREALEKLVAQMVAK